MIVKDNVFGEMEYDYGWRKNEIITIFNEDFEIEVVASAFSEKPISDIQREKYKRFQDDYTEIAQKIENVIEEYKKQYGLDTITLKTLIIQQSGEVGILCDSSIAIEEGLLIRVYPIVEIDSPDNFL